jgi:hypothetical protein
MNIQLGARFTLPIAETYPAAPRRHDSGLKNPRSQPNLSISGDESDLWK